MLGLLFKDASTATSASPNRADIVCFVGYVARRPAAVPTVVKTWLQNQGWRPLGTVVDDQDALLHTPVPLDSFEAFDRLFAWDQRPAAANGFSHPTWLGAAVRSFFRQGGARCFVVRTGDPWAPVYQADSAPADVTAAAEQARRERLRTLFPGFEGTARPSPQDSASWKGHGVILGLPEAAMLCFPDLPEIVSLATLDPVGLAPLPPTPEVFVECGPAAKVPAEATRQISPSPACTVADYGTWADAVRQVTDLLHSHRPDVELVLSLPLPARGAENETRQMPEKFSTAFLQLAYPWLSTAGSEALPGGLEPPDGVLAGALARCIPNLGVARSIGMQPLRGVQGFFPALPGADLRLDIIHTEEMSLLQRVSLLGPTPDGPAILSDVTTSKDIAHRPAPIGRLTAAIIRTSRQIGQTVAFEPSGEQLWQGIRSQLERLMADFHQAGALQGASQAEAFSVRCDETTTSQNDLDNGRVIAEVRFNPSHPIGLITVVLALRDGGLTSLVPSV